MENVFAFSVPSVASSTRWISSSYSVSINAANGLKIDVVDGGIAKRTTFPSGNKKNGRLLDENLQTYLGILSPEFCCWRLVGRLCFRKKKVKFFEKQCTHCWRHTPLRLSSSRYWCSSKTKRQAMPFFTFFKLKIISYFQRTTFEWSWTKKCNDYDELAHWHISGISICSTSTRPHVCRSYSSLSNIAVH